MRDLNKTLVRLFPSFSPAIVEPESQFSLISQVNVEVIEPDNISASPKSTIGPSTSGLVYPSRPRVHKILKNKAAIYADNVVELEPKRCNRTAYFSQWMILLNLSYQLIWCERNFRSYQLSFSPHQNEKRKKNLPHCENCNYLLKSSRNLSRHIIGAARLK